MDTTAPRARLRRSRTERLRGPVAALAVVGTLLVGAAAGAEEAEAPSDARTPPRLAYIHGEVSFWRPGAETWAPAHVNTPLAPGDRLYVGARGGLELQVGPRAFVRAAAETTLELDQQEPDFLRLALTSGHAALDVRSLAPGHTIELATPGAILAVERPGYYRVIVADRTTTVIVRRGGQAALTPAGGDTQVVGTGTQATVGGEDAAAVTLAAAPALDAWDEWNYERTGALLRAESRRYVPDDVYGAADLDRHGTWRVEAEYGPVWVPRGVPVGWAPYTTGSWIWDPYYGWTWVDTAPWGWAPYHYGRWVYVRGHWAWAPGPVVVRPVYAPALVVFFGVGVRGPVGWCALGWGEPVLPWWGRPGFIGRPWWAGWGGPRVVNRVVIQKTVVVKAEHVTVFQNARIKDAVVVVDRDRFGHGPVRRAHLRDDDLRRLSPVRGDLAVLPRAASRVAAPGPAARPPDRVLERAVATRGSQRALTRGVPTRTPDHALERDPQGRAAERIERGVADRSPERAGGGRVPLAPGPQTRSVPAPPRRVAAPAAPASGPSSPAEVHRRPASVERPPESVEPRRVERPAPLDRSRPPVAPERSTRDERSDSAPGTTGPLLRRAGPNAVPSAEPRRPASPAPAWRPEIQGRGTAPERRIPEPEPRRMEIGPGRPGSQQPPRAVQAPTGRAEPPAMQAGPGRPASPALRAPAERPQRPNQEEGPGAKLRGAGDRRGER